MENRQSTGTTVTHFAPLPCTRGAAVVNLDAITANVRALVRTVGPHARLMAIVKANAYGHGAVPVAITALRAGAYALAVACVDEGIQLRRAGIVAPILLLGATPAPEMSRVVAQRLTPTICSRDAAEALCTAARTAGHTAFPVHVKIDSGLHRFGIDAREAFAFVTWLYEQPGVRVEALYTHFSSAEEADGTSTADEYARFVAVVTALRERGISPLLHASNSAATMCYPDLHLDLVRPGFALYGLAGNYIGADRLTQWPALEIHSRISRLIMLAPGDAVGYGRTYIAPEARKAALVGIGYGDGLPRALSNRGCMLVNGQRAPMLGRVSMDQTVVDVTEAGDVAVGDPVTILGRQGDEEITATEIASWADTIGYEIVVGLAPRLPRLYLGGGQIIGVSDLLGDRQLATTPEDAIFGWSSPAG